MKFKAFLIPDVGDAKITRLFNNAVNCQASARADARLMFKQRPEVNSIEVVVCENNEAMENMHEFFTREAL